ncbi:hypothetical protein DEO72_LG5g1641 [Vigna unguiculata]|uniref:Uncharacterized protein n=1 Tax=Vigna unguiculata TaxID=3917 RepID=A0A4D6M007_VIGUN|nr:hypothetical protein DEO72_LG5g1641 [Vigna unguiculata]
MKFSTTKKVTSSSSVDLDCSVQFLQNQSRLEPRWGCGRGNQNWNPKHKAKLLFTCGDCVKQKKGEAEEGKEGTTMEFQCFWESHFGVVNQ